MLRRLHSPQPWLHCQTSRDCPSMHKCKGAVKALVASNFYVLKSCVQTRNFDVDSLACWLIEAVARNISARILGPYQYRRGQKKSPKDEDDDDDEEDTETVQEQTLLISRLRNARGSKDFRFAEEAPSFSNTCPMLHNDDSSLAHTVEQS